jgi:hypothetical protein
MAHRHRYMTRKIGAYEDLPHGRRAGQGSVPKEAYPEIDRRAKDELYSVIGRYYEVTGQTIGRIVRRAGQ